MKFDKCWRHGLSLGQIVLVMALASLSFLMLLPSFARAGSDGAEQERLARFKQAGINTDTVTTTTTTTSIHGSGLPSTTTTEFVAEQNQQPMLGLQSDVAMKAAQDKYSAIVAQGGFPTVPNSALKKGSTGAGVATLNKRLFIEGYLRVEATQGEFAEVFTTATEDAVNKFQRNMGLAVTGRIDAPTLAELNVSAETRLRTIGINIPRLSIYEQNLGDRYLVVNIPAQQLETVSGGHVFSRHNAIVGRPERPSPVVMAPLATVKFNPYWNAPVSIVDRDILPRLRGNRSALKDMNMKVFEGGPNGPEVDPSSVDWSRADLTKYLFREEPGPKNAMATAKIEFMSPFGIYLHDTSEPQLFKTANRFYSSGCIRIEQMPKLVEWVLNGQGGFEASKIASMAQTLERLDVPLATPPQLRVAYLTAWPTGNGTVAFRHDIYDMDGSGFTVGQPMPLGQKSPDGLRYVLKPLPYAQNIDAAEAEGFHLFNLFGSRPSNFNVNSPLASEKKNIFGSNLFTSNVTTKTNIVQVADAGSSKLKKGKKKLKGAKSVGLFDWAAYHQQQATDAKHPAGKKHKAKAADTKAVKADVSKPPKKKKGAVCKTGTADNPTKGCTASAVPPDPTLKP